MVDDLDQGGKLRLWERTYLGPTLGWIMQQVTSIVKVTVGGTTILNPGVTLVEVSVAAPVTIILPNSIPAAGTLVNPITIMDTGGNAGANNITIQGTGTQQIMGLASVVIANNFGAFTLVPDTVNGGWVQQ